MKSTRLRLRVGAELLAAWLVGWASPAWAVKYVDRSVASEGDGSSWGTAFKTLSNAVVKVTTGEEIRVAKGTYTNWALATGMVVGNHTLVGGYPTGGGARDWAANRTIVDGRGNRRAFNKTGAGVFTLDGFTIQNCSNSTAHGGAVSCAAGSLTIRNSLFTNDVTHSSYSGGAIYSTVAGVENLFSNCTFAANVGRHGGALYLVGAGTNTFDTCTFVTNRAIVDGNGGAISMAVGGGRLVVKGCAMRNNVCATLGGAVHRTTGSSRLQNCTIVSNQASSGGGGVYLASSELDGCTFVGNTSSGGNGGGGAQLTVSSRVIGCTFRGNSTTINGGALQITGAGSVSNSVFVGNSAAYATGGGGAIYVNSATFSSFYGCTMASNSATAGNGGALFLVNCNAVVGNCVLRYNRATASNGGGAVYLSTGTPRVRNCLILGNAARRYGGGAWGAAGYPLSLENCTLVGNQVETATSAQGGGGVFNVSAVNTIVVSNTAPFNPDYYSVNCVFTNSCAPGLSGSGNISGAPGFVLVGFGYGANHVAGDYRLAKGSPCIDHGKNDLGWMTTAVDLATNARIHNVIVDMGAYEYKPSDVKSGTVIVIR